jgi:hypothetical protein
MAGVHLGVQPADSGALVVGDEVGVAEGHFDIFMAEEFFHGHEVDAGHYEVRDEGMP